MSDELKSAFKIKGFLEGECEIELEKSLSCTYYVASSGLVYIKHGNGFQEEASNSVNFFTEKQFKKVEPKKKNYIHEYYGIDNGGWRFKHEILTNKDWLCFIHDEEPYSEDLILIKTTEIEE